MRLLSSKILAAFMLLGGLQSAAAADTASKTIRIGFQKSSTLITILKAQGKLENSLAKLGVTVQWAEFMAGRPYLKR